MGEDRKRVGQEIVQLAVLPFVGRPVHLEEELEVLNRAYRAGFGAGDGGRLGDGIGGD